MKKEKKMHTRNSYRNRRIFVRDVWTGLKKKKKKGRALPYGREASTENRKPNGQPNKYIAVAEQSKPASPGLQWSTQCTQYSSLLLVSRLGLLEQKNILNESEEELRKAVAELSFFFAS